MGLVAAALAFDAGPADAAPDLPGVRAKLTTVATGLTQPTALAWRKGDGRVYVAEQTGRVRIVSGGAIVATALTVSTAPSSERGLLGLAFSPDGTKMYVDYTDLDGNTRVDEYKVNGSNGLAIASSRRQVLFQTQPYANHNGGGLAFGPDGMLYISFGDGGGAGDPQGNGQKKSTLLGKMLRIDPRPQPGYGYRIPADNPFIATPGVRKEIWSLGLRNPWRFSFDSLTGDLWIGDVGQGAYEEVDFAVPGEKGTNWGWKLREGNHAYTGDRPAGNKDPIIERAHTSGDCAVIGGYVYRGTSVAKLAGAYLYSDYCTGIIWAAVQSGGTITATRDLGLRVTNPTAFGQNSFGEVFVATRGGTVYRVGQAA